MLFASRRRWSGAKRQRSGTCQAHLAQLRTERHIAQAQTLPHRRARSDGGGVSTVQISAVSAADTDTDGARCSVLCPRVPVGSDPASVQRNGASSGPIPRSRACSLRVLLVPLQHTSPCSTLLKPPTSRNALHRLAARHAAAHTHTRERRLKGYLEFRLRFVLIKEWREQAASVPLGARDSGRCAEACTETRIRASS